jgi:hypothetical protein
VFNNEVGYQRTEEVSSHMEEVLGEPVQLKVSLWEDEKILGTSSSNVEQTTEWK